MSLGFRRLAASASFVHIQKADGLFGNVTVVFLFSFVQESRPLGATLVSGCVIAPGCEDHDQDSGVAKPFSFRLKLATTSSILCLAADNQEDYDQWMHSVAHSAQTPNKPEKVRFFLSAKSKD